MTLHRPCFFSVLSWLAAIGSVHAQQPEAPLALPYMYIESCEGYESAGGGNCDFTVRLTAAYDQPLTVEYFTYTSPNRARGNWANDFGTSFDEPLLAGNAATYSAGQALAGWTVGSGSVDVVGPALWQAAVGKQSLDLNGSAAGRIYVDVATEVGVTYVVSFALAGNFQGAPAVKTLDVKFGATTQSFSFDTTGKSAANMGWSFRSITITATTPVSRLEFISTTAGAYGPAIDEVAVVKPFDNLYPAASAGIDYTPRYGFVGSPYAGTQALVIPAGALSATVSVPVIDDALDEQDESIYLWATLVANGQINNNRGVIYDNDGVPSIQSSNTSVTEGNTGTTDCVFTLALGSSSAQPVQVNYQTGPRQGSNRLGLAESASFESPRIATGISTYSAGQNVGDWTVGSGSIDLVSPQQWRPAHYRQSVDLNGLAPGSIYRDVSMQQTCCWVLDFALAGNPGSGPSIKTVEVFWGGNSIGLFSFDTTGVTTTAMGWQYQRIRLPDPTNGVYRLEFVSRTTGASGPVIDDVVLSQDVGLAREGVDFLHRFGYVGANYPEAAPLVFAPGEIQKTIRVPVVGDLNFESSPEASGLRADIDGSPLSTSVTCAITDNDPAPALAIADASVVEGNSGTRVLSFPVSLSVASELNAYVDYSTANGTAQAGLDYVATSGTLSFQPGETVKNIDVTVLGDNLSEVNETVLLNLSNPVGATPTRTQATGYIMNDDAPVDPIFANGFE